jgi:hypothetical protein
MTFNSALAEPIDLGYRAPDFEYDDAYGKFWEAVNPLPVGSVVGVGYRNEPEQNIVWFRKDSDTDFRWIVVQNDHEVADVRDEIPVGYVEDQDPNTLSMGGDLEVAFIASRGWSVVGAEQILEDGLPWDDDSFWDRLDALPVGSLIATGFVDDGLVFFRKWSLTAPSPWEIVQVDNPNVADVFSVGEHVGGNVVDAHLEIEVAYIVQEGK